VHHAPLPLNRKKVNHSRDPHFPAGRTVSCWLCPFESALSSSAYLHADGGNERIK
jgi:hypothetical protein